MNPGLQAVAALALTTFREAMRNKLLYTILAFACVLILSSWAVGQMSLHQEARVARDMGLGAIFFFGVVLSIVGGVKLVYQEIEGKTVYVLVPKPIHRFQFVAGKYAGLSLTLAVQMGLMAAVLCIALWWLGSRPDAALARALLLLYVEVLVVTAVAVLFSQLLDAVAVRALHHRHHGVRHLRARAARPSSTRGSRTRPRRPPCSRPPRSWCPTCTCSSSPARSRAESTSRCTATTWAGATWRAPRPTASSSPRVCYCSRW